MEHFRDTLAINMTVFCLQDTPQGTFQVNAVSISVNDLKAGTKALG